MLKNYYAQLAPLAFQTDFVVCGTERGGLEPPDSVDNRITAFE